MPLKSAKFKLIFCLSISLFVFDVRSNGQAKPFHQSIPFGESAKVQPVLGTYQKITVNRGENLYSIAQNYQVSMTDVMKINKLPSRKVVTGQKLLLPTMRIVPRNIGTGIVLNIPERTVYLQKDGMVIAWYPVAIGRRSWQTALGKYEVRVKVINPSWKPTTEMIAREGVKDEEVPPGPNNPLGDRWMGWSLPGYGFHSTTAPSTIGTAASHGCVRLTPAMAHKMFDQVSVGWPIVSIYEPILIGKQGDFYYISVFEDVYRAGAVSVKLALDLIKRAGINGIVDEKALESIVRNHDGFPTRIPFISMDESPVDPTDNLPPPTLPVPVKKPDWGL